jgi:cyclohexanone monooxygenase
VSKHPIERLTETGLVTNGTLYEFDAIVFATGFDAMTGALLNMDIKGANGLPLAEKWSAGPRTYLGLMSAGYPNLFMMTGPGSPSVLANMVTGVEHHAEYIDAMIAWAQERGVSHIEAERQAEDEWVEVVNMRASGTLFPRCNSWYLGANVPGKPRVFMPYVGFPDYAARLDEIKAAGYEGFATA